MTHIDNIPHIIQNGITHKNSPNSNQNYKSIGDTSLIRTRDDYTLPNGNTIGEYIPFYLGPRSPMLFVIQNGYNGVRMIHPSKVVYCITNVQKIIDINQDFIYTDGHATDSYSNYYFPEDVNNIENQVDFDATKVKFWKDENDLDLKRRKEAEFLIKQDLAYNYILGFATFDESSKAKLIDLGINKTKVVVKRNFYF